LTAGPPGIPPDRLALLRAVFMQALSDPQLLADAKKMDAPIAAASGEHVQQVISAALQQSPQNLQLLAQAVKAGQ
jgi:tripartite-type tricarboxylate transporter receptor subunit TctC